MGLFNRKEKEQELVPCPRCMQLLPREALRCDLCGHDLREPPAPTVEAGRPAA